MKGKQIQHSYGENKNQANLAGDQANTSGYDSGDPLTITTSEVTTEWVMDSGCTFLMTPIKELFTDFKWQNGGSWVMDQYY